MAKETEKPTAKQTILAYETLDLHDIAPTGEAVGELDGQVVYVPFGIPGERVRVEIVERTRAFARARLVEVIMPAPERIPALCDYFGRCGGCNWQHIRYAAQLELKQATVWQQLTRVAELEQPDVRACLPSFHAYDYRNAAVFTVLANGRPAYAGLAPKSMVAVDACPILEPPLEDELQRAAAFGVPVRREWAIRVPEPIPVGNFNYFVGPKSAFPVNTLAAAQLVMATMEAIEPRKDQAFLDLNCGVGLFTLPLAVMSADVIGVEPDAAAGRDARRNVAAIRNRLFGKVPPRILSSQIGAALTRAEIKTRLWQGAIVQSPARGLGTTTANQIAKLGIARLVYVAADATTMGRDVKLLLRGGYQFDYAQPLDMMPQTHQVQTVVRMSLR